MLDIKKMLTKITKTPLVVEEGETSGWTWRKWSDGTVDCRKYTTFAAVSGSTTATISLPFAFIDNRYLVFITPRRNFTIGQSIAATDGTGNNVQTTTSFAMTWSKSGYNYTGDFSILVIGKWKSVGGGYCLNGLKAVFSRLSAIAERRWRHVKHQEDTHQNPRAARFAGHVQAVHNKRFVQHNVVSEQNLRCIVERVQAYLHGLLNQLGELLCVLELFERKYRTGVCGEKRQHRDFDEFTNQLECHLHQGYALQVAPSEGGCF